MHEPLSRRVHALVFDDPERTVAAARRLSAAGFEISDVHSPFPLHGIEQVPGLGGSRPALPTLVGGAIGLLTAIALQLYTHALSWPLEIGGKSHTALPSIVPVAFELTVLFAAFATVGALLGGARLWPRLAGRTPALQPHPAATDDRFVVLVTERSGAHAPGRFRTLAAELKPERIDEGWRVE